MAVVVLPTPPFDWRWRGDAKRGGSGMHASHERGSFQLGSSVLTRTMWASASVELWDQLTGGNVHA